MASKRRNRRAHKKKLVLNGPSPISKPGQNQKKGPTIPSNAPAAPRGMASVDLGGPGRGGVPQRTNITPAHDQNTVTNPGQIGRIIGLAERLNVLASELIDAKTETYNLKRELADAKAKNESYARELADTKAENESYARELAHAKAEHENYARELANAKAGNETYARELEDAKAGNESCARELADAKAGNESYVRLIDDLGMRIAGLEAWQMDMDTQEKL